MPSEHDKQPTSSGQELAPVDRQKQASRAPRQPKVWTSAELFGDEVEVLIAHEDQLYRLRRTRNGKLILCK